MAKVFIGYETSGAMRRRFDALGHDVISCDLLPAEDVPALPGWHEMGDVFETLDSLWADGWWPDLAIFHPPCTYLTNSAAWAFKDPPYHQQVKTGTLVGAQRRLARDVALNDVRKLMALPIRRKVVENPIGAINTKIRKASQIVQPYQLGDDASKATCFWYVGKDGEELPEMCLPIDPAKRVPGRLVRKAYQWDFVERWSNQTDSGQNRLSPGADRWKDRARTFPGIADAGAQHWGSFLDA